MKKFILLGAAVALLVTGLWAEAHTGYTIRRLTNDANSVLRLQINKRGQVAWISWLGETKWAINLYDGVTTRRLGTCAASSEETSLHLNDRGQVAWLGYDGRTFQVYLYNGTQTLKLTDNKLLKGALQLNNKGQVVWEAVRRYEHFSGEIYFYNGTQTLKLTDNVIDDLAPSINNRGQVVWVSHDGNDYEIYFFDGAKTIRLTDNELNDSCPLINDSGMVVWLGYDESLSPQLHRYKDGNLTPINIPGGVPIRINSQGQVIFFTMGFLCFYNGTEFIQLVDHVTHNYYPRDLPQLNDLGQVMWKSRNAYPDFSGLPVTSELYFYDGTRTIRLTQNKVYEIEPQLNNRGQILWRKLDGHAWKIYYYDGVQKSQFTNNSRSDYKAQLNDKGQIAWCSAGAIYLASPSVAPTLDSMD